MQIDLDFSFKPIFRYGHGRPAHPALLDIIERRREVYRAHLVAMLKYQDEFQRIPREGEERRERWEPFWNNDSFLGLDPLSLYTFVRERRPKLIIEVGAGNSTMFAAAAVRDGGLATRLVSIDSLPPSDVLSLCERVYHYPLEDLDLSVFGELEAGDIVFFDGSHRVFTNTDVTVFFLDVLPYLKPGVLAHVHDIYLPFDYPPYIAKRYFSEQYLLACYLLAGGDRFQVELPNAFISQDRDLLATLDPLWQLPGLEKIAHHGVGFWISAR